MSAIASLESIIVLSSSTDKISTMLVNKLASSFVGFYFLDSHSPSLANPNTYFQTISATEYAQYRTKIPVYALILNPLYFSHAQILYPQLTQSIIQDTGNTRCLFIHPYKPVLVDKISEAAYHQSLSQIHELLTNHYQHPNIYQVFLDELVSSSSFPYVSCSNLLHSNSSKLGSVQDAINPEERVSPMMSCDIISTLTSLLFGYPPRGSQVILCSKTSINRNNQILFLRSQGMLSTKSQSSSKAFQFVSVQPLSLGPFGKIIINSSYYQLLQKPLPEARHEASRLVSNGLVMQAPAKIVQKKTSISVKNHSSWGKLSRFMTIIIFLAIVGLSLIIILTIKSSPQLSAIDSIKTSSVRMINQFSSSNDNPNIILQLAQIPSQVREYIYNTAEKRQIEKDSIALNQQIDSVAAQLYLSATNPSSPPTIPLISKFTALLERQHVNLKNSDELFSSVASISLLKIFHELALQTQPVKVILVHQNDFELQATGGRIMLITEIVLSNGRILDISHHSITELDQSLQGFVTPPSDLSSLKNLSFWQLQEANWSPDFASSAQKISWFYQKQTGYRPHLVIGITPTTINTLVDALTPSIGQSVLGKGNNFRELLLNQYQNGSEKNTEWYSQQINSIFSLFIKLNTNDLNSVYTALHQIVNRQQLQMYSPHPSLQSLIRTAQLSGELQPLPCQNQENYFCQSDFLAVNQTNLGINPVNAYISTTQSHSISLTKDQIQHSHQVEISNLAPTTAYPGGVYQAYIRFLFNRKPTNFDLRINDKFQQNNQIITTQENFIYTLGVPISVRVGETTILKAKYSYNLDRSSTNQYQFTLYKQPGNKSLFKGFILSPNGGESPNTSTPLVIQRPHYSSVQIAI